MLVDGAKALGTLRMNKCAKTKRRAICEHALYTVGGGGHPFCFHAFLTTDWVLWRLKLGLLGE